MKKGKLILILLAVGLMAGVAQATILSNGDFELDLALVPHPFPNPGCTNPGPPTGWEYDRYYGYDVDPWLINASKIGDGSGGDVAVVFGTWNVEGAWDPVVATYPAGAIAAGSYRLEVTTAAIGALGGGWLDVQLGWMADPADPWADYAEFVEDAWTDVSATYGAGVWTTLSWEFDVLPGDDGEGKNWYLWLRGQSYDDYVVVGSAVLVPEPATLALLGLGALMLRRKRS
ncbi:MAG: PEP-CTERM sorting domain-containing protein [Planctomycetes bacterium]|nr:PEP-CTERM sorting domain-containing protein [Planctomycetota bacterium]